MQIKLGSVYLRQAFNQLKTKVNHELYKAKRNYHSKKTEQHKMTLRAHGNKLNDLILNLTPENTAQHSRIE